MRRRKEKKAKEMEQAEKEQIRLTCPILMTSITEQPSVVGQPMLINNQSTILDDLVVEEYSDRDQESIFLQNPKH